MPTLRLPQYYKDNCSWIKTANLHQGQSWYEVIDGTKTIIYCPDSRLIIGFATSLDKRIANSIKISIQLSGAGNLDKIVEGLGLKFDPDRALDKRLQQQEDDYQEDDLTEEIEEDNDKEEDSGTESSTVDDLGLDILRREASQLMNNS